jgi:hypothetical protein
MSVLIGVWPSSVVECPCDPLLAKPSIGRDIALARRLGFLNDSTWITSANRTIRGHRKWSGASSASTTRFGARLYPADACTPDPAQTKELGSTSCARRGGLGSGPGYRNPNAPNRDTAPQINTHSPSEHNSTKISASPGLSLRVGSLPELPDDDDPCEPRQQAKEQNCWNGAFLSNCSSQLRRKRVLAFAAPLPRRNLALCSSLGIRRP